MINSIVIVENMDFGCANIYFPRIQVKVNV